MGTPIIPGTPPPPDQQVIAPSVPPEAPIVPPKPNPVRGGPGIIVTGSDGQSLAAGEIVRTVDQYRQRSYDARWHRRPKNRQNWAMLHMDHDWSHKNPGQSRVMFPDLPIAIRQIAAEIENQLITFENWFGVESLGGISVFDPDTVRLLLKYSLERLYKPGNEVETARKISSVIAESLILLLCESEVTYKVYAVDAERPVWMLDTNDPERPTGMVTGADEEPLDGDLEPHVTPVTYERAATVIRRAMIRSSRLAVDLIPYEDSYPDPSPANLFHIHEVSRHISELRGNDAYDPDVIASLEASAHESAEKLEKSARDGQRQGHKDPFMVRVRECWGDIVDSRGNVVERNKLTTTVNGQLLRPPTENPFWHGYRPLVRVALLTTPLAPTHDALIDYARPAAEAENELGSLLLDGGLASVYGTRQVQPDMLADPTTVAKGLPPAFTAVLRKGADPNVPFMTRVDEGSQPPSYGLEMLARMAQARQTGSATQDLRIGQLPPRQTQATEVVTATDARQTLFENNAVHLEEQGLVPILTLGWLTNLQYMDDFSAPELVQVLGAERALILQRLTAEERFYLLGNNVKFNVRGLRNLLARVKDFQKITTILTTVATSPMIAAAWNQKYSTPRLLEKMVRAVNLDPTELEYRADELPGIPPEMIEAAAGGVTPPGAGTGVGAALGPSNPNAGEIEQGFAQPNPTGFRGTQV